MSRLSRLSLSLCFHRTTGSPSAPPCSPPSLLEHTTPSFPHLPVVVVVPAAAAATATELSALSDLCGTGDRWRRERSVVCKSGGHEILARWRSGSGRPLRLVNLKDGGISTVLCLCCHGRMDEDLSQIQSMQEDPTGYEIAMKLYQFIVFQQSHIPAIRKEVPQFCMKYFRN